MLLSYVLITVGFILHSFIWSVDVSDPNTTRQQVGLASFSSIHRIAAYNSSYYMEGERLLPILVKQQSLRRRLLIGEDD